MTFPANPTLEAAPYGPMPVLPVVGPQGGPYVVAGPQVQTLAVFAPRTGSFLSPVLNNYGFRGVLIHLSVSVNPGGAQTLAVNVAGVDGPTGDVVNLLSVPASATPGGWYLLYPGASGAAVEGVAQTRNGVLTDQFTVGVVHSGAGAWTYALTAHLIL